MHTGAQAIFYYMGPELVTSYKETCGLSMSIGPRSVKEIKRIDAFFYRKYSFLFKNLN